MSNIDQTVDDFNTALLDMVQFVAKVCPTTVVGRHISQVETLFADPKNRLKFIDTFVLHVLQYKDQIDRGDEEFFLQHSFDNHTKDSDDIASIFTFKDTWKGLSKNSKSRLTTYFQILAQLSEDYFMMKRF